MAVQLPASGVIVTSECKGTDILLLRAGAVELPLQASDCTEDRPLFLPLQLHNELTMAQKLSVLLLLFGRKKAHHLARPNLSFFVFQV